MTPARNPPTPWRDLDAAAREREYSPSSCIGGNYQPFVRAYAQKSGEARSRTPGRLGLAYGPKAAQRLDLFVPSGQAGLAPLLVFMHGGYWQELSKDDSSFAASHCVEQGFALAVLDYTLAPDASVAQIVGECRDALAWLHANAASLGLDSQRFVVAGSSAGAHLAAMTALPRPGAPALRAAVLVSGIYELEPLVGTSINDALCLTLESARELSPALLALQGFPRAIVAWGEVETPEFKRQSHDFAARLGRAGVGCETIEVAQRNHFDVILGLADTQDPLGRAVTALLRTL